MEFERKAKENYEISEKFAQDAKKTLEQLNDQKAELEEKMRKSAKDLLSDYLEEAEDLVDEIKEQVKKGDEQALFEARRLKKKLSEIRVDEEKPVKSYDFIRRRYKNRG